MIPFSKPIACVALAVFAPLGVLAADTSAALERVEEQLRTHLIHAPEITAEHLLADPVAEDSVKTLATSLRNDGTWKDIDYGDKSRGHWTTRSHLERACLLACAWAGSAGALRGNPVIRAAALRAFDHWLSKDYRNSNWWQNEIGVPRLVAQFLIVMEKEVTPEEMHNGLKIVGRAGIGRTGQNLIWQSGIVLMRAMLQKDVPLARRARDAIAGQVAVSKGDEGLQPDHSFHQHGPQLQFGNYGLAFASDIITWTEVLRGTSFAMEPQKAECLRDYLLKGLASVVWRGTMDINACGRQLFPEAPARKAGTLGVLLADMALADPAHAAQYQAAAQRCGRGVEQNASENRMFWRSAYMTHRRPGYFASVRMCSRDIIGAESCNGENLQGYYLGDGALYVYQTGDEYQDIFPVWNWRRIPGVTAPQTAGRLPVLDATGYRTNAEFVGGVSSGTFGAAAMELNRNGLTGSKSWFFFDHKIICLGAGITSDGEAPVFTSIEQCHAQGPVSLGTGPEVGTLGEAGREFRSSELPAWIHHNHTGYVCGTGDKLVVRKEIQSGSWKTCVYDAGSASPVESEVFSMWIDHGVRPRGASYAYTVLPEASARQVAAYAASPDMEVLSNTSALQAVVDAGSNLRMAVFYQPGTLPCGSGRRLAVDRPCLLMLGESRDGISLMVADPTAKLSSLTVTLDGRPELIQLPQKAPAHLKGG